MFLLRICGKIGKKLKLKLWNYRSNKINVNWGKRKTFVQKCKYLSIEKVAIVLREPVLLAGVKKTKDLSPIFLIIQTMA